MERIKKLIGYSGCRLYLYSRNDSYFVRKYSKNEKYNPRLSVQIEKQRFMYDISNGSFQIPAVLNIGRKGSSLYFDMEYIEGETVLNYLNIATYKDIDIILGNIFKALLVFKSRKCSSGKDIYTQSKNKVLDILKTVNIGLRTKKKILNKIELLKRHRFPDTFCHGDLTLENIMIDRNKDIFFIDIQDVYYDSYWLDIAKLFQNLEADAYKINNRNLDISVAKKDYVFNKLNCFCKNHASGYHKVHSILMMLNFLRMLPYAKNPRQFSIILKKTELYLKEK